MTIQTASKEETQKLGEEFAQKIKSGGLVLLFGNLGAGKTTFTQGLAKGLGIDGNVVSPTFVLERRYELPATSNKFTLEGQLATDLVHIDLYRLNDEEEIKAIGIKETVAQKENIVLIEWPEKVIDLLPKKRWEIKFETTGENEREIQINQKG